MPYFGPPQSPTELPADRIWVYQLGRRTASALKRTAALFSARPLTEGYWLTLPVREERHVEIEIGPTLVVVRELGCLQGAQLFGRGPRVECAACQRASRTHTGALERVLAAFGRAGADKPRTALWRLLNSNETAPRVNPEPFDIPPTHGRDTTVDNPIADDASNV